MEDTAALKFMLPWLHEHVAQTQRIMGKDFWAYGIHENMRETFLRYHFEQGLSKRQLAPRELFAPETFEAFKI